MRFEKAKGIESFSVRQSQLKSSDIFATGVLHLVADEFLVLAILLRSISF
jgi:hypothetical protein